MGGKKKRYRNDPNLFTVTKNPHKREHTEEQQVGRPVIYLVSV